jgi:NADH:ubiquinone oxidoreductase subunit 6 (chain J)
LAARRPADALVRPEDFNLHLFLCSLTVDDSEVPIRSTDEVRLEGFASAVTGEHPRHELHCGYFMIQLVFLLFAAVAAGAAINVLIQKHVLYSALSLILMLTAMSILFIFLRAEFLAMIQIIVYAGAIMVLFVFVIMLLNLPADEDGVDQLRWLKFIGIPLGLFFLFFVLATLWNVEAPPASGTALNGSPRAIGESLFTDYLLPFEVTSLLILIALVGAVVFAKKDL